jgi:hypothetical protein
MGRIRGVDEALADARRLTQAFTQMTRNLARHWKWISDAEVSDIRQQASAIKT